MTIDKPDWWEQWTYFDEEVGETRLDPEAPADVKADWTRLQNMGGYGEPEIILED